MGFRTKRWLALGAVLCMAGVPAACGDDDDNASTSSTSSVSAATTGAAPASTAPAGSTTSGGATSGGATSSAAPATTAAAAGEHDPTGEITLAYPTQVSTLDPHLVQNPARGAFIFPIYDRLTRLANDFTVEPMLATSWDMSVDGKQVTLHLRDDVTFPDGTSVDSAAVKASLERAQTLEGSTVKPALAAITGIEVPDATTVVLTLQGGGADLPAVLATSAGAVINPKVIGRAGVDLALAPPPEAGSGPYQLVEFKPGESVEYKRSGASYWDPTAGFLANFTFRVLGDPGAVMNGVQAGDLDVGFVSGDGIPSAETLAKQGAFNGHKVATISANNLMIVPDRPKLADPKVREAITLALDKEAIGPQLTSGNCVVTDQSLLNEDHWAYDDTITPRSHDVAQAKSLMSEAGVNDLTIDLAYVNSQPYYQQTAEIIQQQLSEIGIKANLTPVPGSDLISQITTRQVDAAVYPTTAQVDPNGFVNALFTGGVKLVPEAEQATVSALATQATDPTLSLDERADIYHQIWEQNWTENWTVPLCIQSFYWIYRDGVTGVEDMTWTPMAAFDQRNLGIAKD